ncbi:hypothetical protein [Streptomyces sp. CB03911]|uniref:hypothetical protein n=1 Tax=Streptomyces sp. CB03911 TaxID=1804758 RepID=UPI00093E091F|nr:hypothetical protein [Streptomyces sp. CB03911]OKI19310.1 hypothetical protein A6A07_07355 [Streptomyces sp. CB03911]
MTDISPAEAQENEATSTGYVTAELEGVDLRILPAGQWRPSFLRALRAGDFDAWALLALHPEDVETFVELDATFDALSDFTTRAMSATGEAPGKSRSSSRSSRTTRKR